MRASKNFDGNYFYIGLCRCNRADVLAIMEYYLDTHTYTFSCKKHAHEFFKKTTVTSKSSAFMI